jgi:hypothetical protein
MEGIGVRERKIHTSEILRKIVARLQREDDKDAAESKP